MTEKTHNHICSVCGQSLNKNDDVVFCPECGAPYHRECYKQKGACVFAELHGTENQFSPDLADELIRRYLAGESLQIERAKEAEQPIPEPAKPEAEPEQEPDNAEKNHRHSRPNIEDAYRQYQQTINAESLGGLKESDDIGGVTAGDAARFVVLNPQRYVPLFSRFARAGKKFSFNLFAFLFPECWFFFRKLYKPGLAVALILSACTLLSQPASAFLNQMMPTDLSTTQTYEFIFKNITSIPLSAQVLMLVGSLISTLLHIFCGLFADRIYQKHTFSKIKAFRKESPDASGEELFYKGGINPFLILLGTAITNFLPTLLLFFIE